LRSNGRVQRKFCTASWQGQNPYSPETQIALLTGLLDYFGVQQAILVGNSAGGTVAMQTALAYPERVAALVLVDPAVYSGGGSPAWLRLLLMGLAEGESERIATPASTPLSPSTSPSLTPTASPSWTSRSRTPPRPKTERRAKRRRAITPEERVSENYST
jgi:pimeloyl-ACP methyl ester carboxylesterase